MGLAVSGVWVFAFALWPVMTLLAGGLGLSPLVALCGFVVAPFAVTRVRFRPYMLFLALALAYAAASAVWSPREIRVFEFDFAEGDFAIRSEPLRVAGSVLFSGLIIASIQRLSERQAAAVGGFATLALLVQAAIFVVLTLFEQQTLEMFADIVPDESEIVQNITRGGLLFTAAAPVAALWLARGRSSDAAFWIAAAMVAPGAFLLLARGVMGGVLALGLGVAAAGLVAAFPRRGFLYLAGLVVFLLMTAPLTFGWLASGVDIASVDSSGEWRLAIWRRVVEVIGQNPLHGSGVGVLRTMDDVFASGPFAGQLIVPGHAHNMFLQVWAEMGALGATLVSAAILAGAARLPSPAALGRAGVAAAGLAATVIVVAAVSFDLWNDWWWAAVGLLCGLIALFLRAPARSAEPRLTDVSARGSEARSPAAQGLHANVGEDNNFNLLRLAFALTVVIYHIAELSAASIWEVAIPSLELAAELAVQGFFIVSGYLVYASLERSRTLADYGEKRVRRLVPAYAVVIIASFAAALLFSPEARSHLGDALSYLGWNLAFLNFMQPELPGVFAGNPHTEVNGALWTIKVEVGFYVILPLLALVLRFANRFRWFVIIAIYIAAEVWRRFAPHFLEGGAGVELAAQTPGQMSFFITGVALYFVRDNITWRSLLPVIGVGCLIGSIAAPSLEPLRALGLGVTLVWIATAWPRPFDPARFGDLSYGAYIIHFPLIQVMTAAGWFAVSPWLAGGAAMAGTLALAALMWVLVERPALRRDSAYRRGGAVRSPLEAAA